MTDKYADLRAALDAGPTPGPWIKDKFHPHILDARPGSSQSLVCRVAINTFNDEGRKNEAFICAAHPDTIRALLAERDRLREAAQMLADWAEHEVGADPSMTPGLAEVRAALAQKQGGSNDNQD